MTLPEGFRLLTGSCLDVLPTLPANHFAAVVTDTPYNLTSIVKRFGAADAAEAKPGTDGAFRRVSRGFMGQAWDGSGIAFQPETWRAVGRVCRPGAHLAAFGGSRTHHRLMVALEDAGWEIRDVLFWLYGSGFPKNHDMSKAFDRLNGAERMPDRRPTKPGNAERRGDGTHGISYGDGRGGFRDESAPVSDDAKEWDGWGTALKPAYEPIILARWPISESSVARNVRTWGTGAINIEASRLGDGSDRTSGGKSGKRRDAAEGYSGGWSRADGSERPDGGRYPPNILLDETAAALLDDTADGEPARFFPRLGYGPEEEARFRYSAKASQPERERGLDAAPRGRTHDGRRRPADNAYQRGMTERGNVHPTVKPVSVCRWLIRLICPPGGPVLDPFMGSGTTGIACLDAVSPFTGIDLSPEYVQIASARIAGAYGLLFRLDAATIKKDGE